MSQPDDFDLEQLFDEPAADTATPARAPERDLRGLLRKIPVRLTLEVGGADVSLADLFAIEHGSVIELDKLAGEPLDIRVNGTLIGRAEVVVSGENYGLRVVELSEIDVDSFTP